MQRSIDTHFGLPCSVDTCSKYEHLLSMVGYRPVNLPAAWQDTGLKWFRRGESQIQLIPETFHRNTGNPVLQDALITKPHLALSVEALPTQVDLHEIGLRSIGKSVCRPDGLRQLYVMANDTDSFFMELNTQDQTCKRDTNI